MGSRSHGKLKPDIYVLGLTDFDVPICLQPSQLTLSRYWNSESKCG